MSLSFEAKHANGFQFELKPKAKLAVSNDLTDFFWVNCDES